MWLEEQILDALDKRPVKASTCKVGSRDQQLYLLSKASRKPPNGLKTIFNMEIIVPEANLKPLESIIGPLV
jgi:hypothetical protein